MKKYVLSCGLCYFMIHTLSAQLANWTGYGPSKFPTNLSGQIHGQTRISQMKFHPTNANKYYAVTGSGAGIYKSTNGGASFTLHTSLGFVHVGGGGGEVVNSSVFNTTGDNAIVDWVFVELRDATTPTTVLYTRSALIQVDGDIVDVDGVSPLLIQAPVGSYYIAIKHRNHLGFRTAATVPLSSVSTAIDFTNNSKILYGATPLKSIDFPFIQFSLQFNKMYVIFAKLLGYQDNYISLH